MKIMLATPLMKERRADLQYIPLGLAYLASVLEKAGHEVSVLDVRAELLNEKQILSRVLAFNPSVFGITSNTCQINEAVGLLELVKKNFPNIITVIGGPHVSALPEATLNEFPFIDICVAGEGEITITELCERLQNNAELKSVHGLAYRNNGKVLLNEQRAEIKDLDLLPFPDRDLFPLAIYNKLAIECKSKPLATMITSRGCPHGCTFCCKAVFGSNIRMRSAENVIEELEYLVEKKGYREIHIIDDNFTFDAERAKRICREIIRRKWKVNFALPNGIRVHNFTEELAGLLKQAGFYFLWFGVESGDQKVIDEIKKGIKIEQVVSAVAISKKFGFFTGMYFVVGLPGSSQQSEMMSLELAKRLEPDVIGVGIFTPYPGSALYKHDIHCSWKSYRHDFAEHKFTGDQFDEEYIIRQFDIISQRFYFRPKYYFNLIKRHKLFGVKRVWINFKNFLFRRLQIGA